MWRKQSTPPPQGDDLDTVAIRLNNRGDAITYGQMIRGGTLITGDPGSGKTSTSGAVIRRALLTCTIGGVRAGGLVCAVKPGEADMWEQEAAAVGREGDVIRVILAPNNTDSLASYHCFDPCFYEMNRPDRGAGSVTNLTAIINTISTIGTPHAMGGGGDSTSQFFQKRAEALARAAMHVLIASGERVSLQSIQRIVVSLPTEVLPDDPDDLTPAQQRWYKVSFTGQCITAAAERAESGALQLSQVNSVSQAIEYLGKEWVTLAPQTRTSIQETLNSKISELLEHPFSHLLASGKCTFLPEQTYLQGKIIVLDMPITQYGMPGRIAQAAILQAFLQAGNRRDMKKHRGLMWVYIDECQYLVSKACLEAAQLAREQRLCLTFITQSLSNLSVEFGENQVGSKTNAFLGLMGLKILHQQGESATNKWAAELFGKKYVEAETLSPGGPSMHMEPRWRVDPSTFAMLPVPSWDRPYSTAVVWRGGQTWNTPDDDGDPAPHLFATFPLLAALEAKEEL